MRAQSGTENVMSSPHVRDPIAHRLVDRFLQGGLAGVDRDHFGAQKSHSSDIERLSLHIGGAHVDHALAAESGGHRRGSYAMLAGASLGNNATLPHPAREKNIVQGLVDLLPAGMLQILTLQINLRGAELPGYAFRKLKRCPASCEIAGQLIEFILESGIDIDALVFR